MKVKAMNLKNQYGKSFLRKRNTEDRIIEVIDIGKVDNNSKTFSNKKTSPISENAIFNWSMAPDGSKKWSF